MIFTINNCTVDTGAYQIRRDGQVIPVEPQVFDLLVLLLKNRDRLVTKDEIIEHIWHGRIVSEASLSSRIKAARQAIGDDGASQGCIRTVHRRGFRVVAEVTKARRRRLIPTRSRKIFSRLPPSSGMARAKAPRREPISAFGAARWLF